MNGILRPGDHVITSSMEHNSVMRPLRALEKEGLEITVLPCSREGFLDPDDARRAVRKNTAMCVLNHASNVVGAIQPIATVGEICRNHGILFFVDAAQTAGALSINMPAAHIDLLAFTGHKALLGPQGTGGLVIGDGFDERRMKPLKRGGTGSRSELEEQPDFLPDLFESGTPNGIGLAGLKAGLNFILQAGLDRIRSHEIHLTDRLIKGLSQIPGIILYGPREGTRQCPTVSFNLEKFTPSEVALRMDEGHGIFCRMGLHCAPAAHRTIGTFPEGTVRLSMSYLNTEEEVQAVIETVTELAKGGKKR